MIDDETKSFEAKSEDSKSEDSKSEDANLKPPRRRLTLDSQLVTYWEREALRLDALAAGARWRWMARAYARKAQRARAQGARSGAREAKRDDGPGQA